MFGSGRCREQDDDRYDVSDDEIDDGCNDDDDDEALLPTIAWYSKEL